MLEEFLVTGVFSFMIVFMRFGTAIMIMPGIGDSYVPGNIRLMFAMAFCFVMAPVIQPQVPFPLPTFGTLIALLTVEFMTGLFIGTIARILMMAMDTAGMFISLMSGVANAQVFNPALATQGSLFGAFLTVTAVCVLFATNLHHLLFYGLVESYQLFPMGGVIDTRSMSDLVARAVSASFLTGFQIAMPFVVISLVLYVGMGVLARLMPQIQIFMLAVPVQILLALVIMTITLSSMMLFFITRFEQGMTYFLSQKEKIINNE